MRRWTGWLLGAVLLFFSSFGHTDAAGFHHGWLITTRPGWLWFTVLWYLSAVLAGSLGCAWYKGNDAR